ncbi:hypothetical protein OESDEN_01137 [Oesophagostomum dentatum]|uniref:Uncharacterized protein n=1 Tax=Oesophagostomum dentatum TaxID=61180 RepID=A0A0B1TNM8_OESDE|nr:hypothetical protein OESDEN_01137 [Oesophagostomum dentatum]
MQVFLPTSSGRRNELSEETANVDLIFTLAELTYYHVSLFNAWSCIIRGTLLYCDIASLLP